ncbi:uncharacterized protein F5147DRAFT_787551 [Suillus discolor]|uniref:Uncharacterized protein n=1 Tax=Suillus discolor TaxID=1912936 RepID=A0A9P7JML2_9AGAM|nr:uncharacterized protein F5147DRAFT_787551 [Suillus discolor]KAG2089872.1 hypothetical protein F5147DRAFT_787551 [Suillus discolor]
MSQKLNEANLALPVGQQWKLTVFIAEHGQELTTGYCCLSASEKEKLHRKVHNLRENCVKIVHSNPKALQKQVNVMFNNMEKEWENITSRTGVKGFYIAVHGDVEHFHESKIFYTPKAQSFIKEISHLDPKCFALKFESWVTGDFDTHADVTHCLPSTKLISLCCTNIQEGLNAIMKKYNLSKKKVKMNYDNYEQKVIEMHGIALEGWTCGKVRNPSKIGHRKDLVMLLDALVNECCLWIQLTKEQVENHIATNHERVKNGESIYKPHKAMKRKVTGGAKSVDIIGDTDSSEDEVVDEDDEAQGTEGAVVVG